MGRKVIDADRDDRVRQCRGGLTAFPVGFRLIGERGKTWMVAEARLKLIHGLGSDGHHHERRYQDGTQECEVS